tara:strand:- start:209287 stop:210387 length:1101 start_codon:yes stop_codon:yes gene_type:complete
MDTTDSKIIFDENGVCDHCNGYYKNILPYWDTGEVGHKNLMALADKIKHDGKGKPFDCIMGMSGGVDSSYLLYIAKVKMGLRPLVFHVDCGWNSQLAVNNIEMLIDKLGVDLYTEVIDWEEMKDLQLAFFKASIPHIDWPQDHAIFASLYKFAEKHNVKHILTGANFSTECVKNPMEWTYMGSDLVQLKDIHRKYGQRPLTNFPTTSILRHKVYLRYLKSIKVHKPLNYAPFIKNEAMEFMMNEYGWIKYPQKHFESRFTRFYEGYWMPKKFGFDTRRVQLSSLILTKQTTRDEALEVLKKLPYDEETIAQDFEYIGNKLDVSVDELQSYMDLPNKFYWDYKNQVAKFVWGTKVMKLLGLERRTIR